MARSEEQKKDLKLKLYLAATVVVVGASIYAVGPGLPKLVERQLRKPEHPTTPKFVAFAAGLFDVTYRKEQALSTIRSFYLHYSGDELNFEPLRRAAEDAHSEAKYPIYERFTPEHLATFLPWISSEYDEEARPRPKWVGGEGAKPHPKLADVLIRMARIYEYEEKNYEYAQHIYRCVKHAFPETEAAKSAQAGMIRAATRSF